MSTSADGAERMPTPTPDLGGARNDTPAPDVSGGLFGRIAVAMDLCTDQDIVMAVALARSAPEGAAAPTQRLGEILVDAGVLTAAQVQEVLQAQSKMVLHCPACDRQFNAAMAQGESLPECPACGGPLSPPAELTHVGVDITTDGAPPAPAADPETGTSFADLTGRTLGPYHLEALIGEGGMGAVFRARHAVLKRPTALKVLPADLSHEKDRVRRFMREAEAMARVRHVNIVHIHDVGSDGDYYYIAMELVEGGCLADRMDGAEPMPVAEATRLVEQVAEGLAAAHAQGIVHRDIKPENILLTADGVPKIADFGLAKSLEGVEGISHLTHKRALMGTPAYMSPEQVRGEPADARSDVYALGVMFFEMLTGRRPFLGTRPMAIMMRHLNEEAPSPQKLRADLPLSLSNVIERMLAKAPAERYAGAHEVLAALQAIERGEQIAYTARRIRRRRWRILTAALVLITLGAGSGALYAKLSGRVVESPEARRVRLLEEADAAYRGGDDDTARARLEELRTVAPDHADVTALGARLAAFAGAQRAWRAGTPDAVLVAVGPLLAADAGDRRARQLAGLAAALASARRALLARDPAGARTAADQILAEAGTHAEATRIRELADRLAAAAEAQTHDDWPAVARSAQAALALDRSEPWATELANAARATLVGALEQALEAHSLEQAEIAATACEAAGITDGSVRPLLDRARRERAEYDRRLQAGVGRLAAGDGQGAREQLERAAALWPSPEVQGKLREARVAELRTSAARAHVAGDHRHAVEWIAEALALAPADPDVEAESRRYQYARDQALDSRAAALFAHARRRLREGALDEAERTLQSARSLAPDHPEGRALAEELAARRATPDGFVYVAAGRWKLGAPDAPNNPPREVTLPGFYLGRLEVTNAEFHAFVAAGGYTDPVWWGGADATQRAAFVDETGAPGPAGWRDGAPPQGQERWPVTAVSALEAQAYARWVGARLPTEEEWEVGAAYGPTRNSAARFPWGTDWDGGRIGVEAEREPAIGPVGTHPGDRSGWGCLDMGGSAKEWTASPWTPDAPHLVLRGGCTHPMAVELADPRETSAVTHRLARADPAAVRIPGVGFRLARSLGGVR